MADFMKCKKCREEYLDLGGSGYSACPRCGTMNAAERNKPQAAPTRDWTCSKCHAEYSIKDASAYSVCPKCGHRNRNRATSVTWESRPRNEDPFGVRDARRSDWNAKASSKAKKTAAPWIALVLMIGTGYFCSAVMEMGFVGTVIISLVIWVIVYSIAAKVLRR